MLRVIGLGFILAIIFSSLTACIQSSDCFREDVFCAGLVTDTLGIEDHGINQDAWAGLQNAKVNKIINRVEYIESVDTRDYQKNITYFADNGFDVIITTGIGLRDETQRGADQYADAVFIGFNQPKDEEATRPNLIVVTFAEDQIGFAAGVLAVRISKTGSVGAVCETSEIDSMWRYCEGFRAGVKFADKNVKPLIIYRENGEKEKLFLDETWGYDTSKSLIVRGADVIFAAGGVTGQGALRAAVESQVMAIGAERDQAMALGHSSNSWVVTSIVGDAQFEIEKMTRLLKGGNISREESSRIKFLTLAPKFPENLTQEINAILTNLWNKGIKTNVTTMKP